MLHLFDFGKDWVISPAGGMTGEAYIAQSSNEKIFLKRNSSPFLAVLSAEGIVPKLLWTKRMENGDVVTAQRWLKGRVLNADEMKSKDVAELLYKIHSSKPLLNMLSRLGKEPVTPHLILRELKTKLESLQQTNQITIALQFLESVEDKVDYPDKVVCHSDINHNNWLLSQEGSLYLIDWEQAVIADPALDLAMVLYWYIEPTEWERWLENYGGSLTDSLKLRLHWYMIAHTLTFMLWYSNHEQHEEAACFGNDLANLNEMIKHVY